MKNVKIYNPVRNVMQSGLSKSEGWILEYESENVRKVDPLMGWTSSDDTLKQVKLDFRSSEGAIAFAKKNNWEYTLLANHTRRVKPKNYSDNFKYIPEEDTKKA